MPKRHDKITKSVNYDYYWDILFCTVPLWRSVVFITERARC